MGRQKPQYLVVGGGKWIARTDVYYPQFSSLDGDWQGKELGHDVAVIMRKPHGGALHALKARRKMRPSEIFFRAATPCEQMAYVPESPPQGHPFSASRLTSPTSLC